MSATQSTTRVPFLDLGVSTGEIRDEFLAEVGELLATNAFTNGRQVAEFEAAFAAYCGTSGCVGLASGLDALRLGLAAAGIGPGDEVLVPAHTFIATFEAVSQVGAVPVPVDVREDDYNIDVAAAADAIGPRTRAILPVHLYGQMADMRALLELRARHDLVLLEDACQAHGATRDGVRAGAAGTCAAFSFYPGKNLGAFGDAGALVTNDEAIARVVRALREHGQSQKYHHDLIGYTARLDTIQAIALGLKLPLLDGWNTDRRSVAAYYAERLDGIGDLVVPNVPDGSEPVWHLYVVRTSRRDELVDRLRAEGIGVGLHYPEAVHRSAAYASLGHAAGSFPVAEKLVDEILSLPVFPRMTEEQCAVVVDVVRAFFANGG